MTVQMQNQGVLQYVCTAWGNTGPLNVLARKIKMFMFVLDVLLHPMVKMQKMPELTMLDRWTVLC